MTAPQAQEVKACGSCGGSLASDQRYCLNCGARSGEPRLDFRAHLPGRGAATKEAAAPQPAAPPDAASRPQRDYTPLAAAGGVAVLGLMLLIGVLIGRGDGTSTTPPPTQVLRVQGGGGGGTTAAEESTGKDKGESAKKAKAKGGALAGGGAQPKPSTVASDDELEALQEQSPQEYAENSAKLPDEIATPGKAPPTDNKAPGGGSKGTAIE